MPYTPQNLTTYINAYSGAYAGMTASNRNIRTVAFANVAATAGAFAEAVDTAWGAGPISTVQAQALQEASEGTFQNRSPAGNARQQDPATYATIAAAIVAMLQAANTYFAAEGISPNLPSGGGDPITLVTVTGDATVGRDSQIMWFACTPPGAAMTLTLDATEFQAGDMVIVTDIAGAAEAYNVNVAVTSGSFTWPVSTPSGPAIPAVQYNYGSITFLYDGAVWQIVNSSAPRNAYQLTGLSPVGGSGLEITDFYGTLTAGTFNRALLDLRGDTQILGFDVSAYTIQPNDARILFVSGNRPLNLPAPTLAQRGRAILIATATGYCSSFDPIRINGIFATDFGVPFSSNVQMREMFANCVAVCQGTFWTLIGSDKYQQQSAYVDVSIFSLATALFEPPYIRPKRLLVKTSDIGGGCTITLPGPTYGPEGSAVLDILDIQGTANANPITIQASGGMTIQPPGASAIVLNVNWGGVRLVQADDGGLEWIAYDWVPF